MNITNMELYLRGIPESFLFIIFAYLIDKKTIDKKMIIITSVIFAICGYLVRFFGIPTGINTIINSVILVVILFYINKVSFKSSLKATVLSSVIMILLEEVNYLIIYGVFKVESPFVYLTPTQRVLYFYPSLIVFAFVIYVYYRKGNNKDDDSNRNSKKFINFNEEF